VLGLFVLAGANQLLAAFVVEDFPAPLKKPSIEQKTAHVAAKYGRAERGAFEAPVPVSHDTAFPVLADVPFRHLSKSHNLFWCCRFWPPFSVNRGVIPVM
jgi:hypothetical protein